jgi:hypothetical protein
MGFIIVDLYLDVEGKDSISVIVHRLSKVARFISCSKKVNSAQSGNLSFDHIVQLHGFSNKLFWIEILFWYGSYGSI